MSSKKKKNCINIYKNLIWSIIIAGSQHSHYMYQNILKDAFKKYE